jgi:hypothetical protein
MDRTRDRNSLHERQVRVIGLLSSIDDPDLIERVERLIDMHRSGLRPLNDAEMAAILDDLRHEVGPT